MTFHIMTFGCQMNVNDSQWLARVLVRCGFTEVPLDSAQIVILNTCSVREKPEKRVYAALGRIKYLTRNTPKAFVVVAGCVAQQLGQALLDKFSQVRLVLGSDGLSLVEGAIARLLVEPKLRLNLTNFTEAYPERDAALEAGLKTAIGYVNIMQGCDNYCAYCIVPYTRGPQKSRQLSAVLDECKALLDSGVKEINLLGQNVNAYGQDLQLRAKGSGFVELARAVLALPGVGRLRFTTPHPKDFTQETIGLFAEFEEVCPRVHLPLQAGSDKILGDMGRKYTRSDFLRIVEGLHKVRSDLAVSTDIIVGFPGETEANFADTLSIMDEVQFMASYSFMYSDRPGTAANALSFKVSPEVKLERLNRLQEKQDALESVWLTSRLNLTCPILLEAPSLWQDESHQNKSSSDRNNFGPDESHASELFQEHHKVSWKGRDPWGDTVNVAVPKGEVGLLVDATITKAKRHSLVATC